MSHLDLHHMYASNGDEDVGVHEHCFVSDAVNDLRLDYRVSSICLKLTQTLMWKGGQNRYGQLD